MDFKQGAEVKTADGEKVGHVHRVVINPLNKEISHVVVRKGFLFTEDKVLPIDRIDLAAGEEVRLKPTQESLESLPKFEEEYYVVLDERDLPETDYEDVVPTYYGFPHQPVSVPMEMPFYAETKYIKDVERNLPDDNVPLKEGADVYDVNGDKVGQVEELITLPHDERVTHLVLSEGFLLKEEKAVPAIWISHINEDKIYLAVRGAIVDRLQSVGA